MIDAVSIIRGLYQVKDGVLVIPYPYLSSLLVLSLLPRRFRPPIIVDVYNSLWISLIEDRRIRPRKSISARILRTLEGRALHTADALVVDTERNAEKLGKLHSLQESTLVTAPLALDPAWHVTPSSTRADTKLRVLFIGTMIPLHGLEVIAQAVSEFTADDGIEFEFIGTGQSDYVIAQLASEIPFVTWTSEWLDAERLRGRLAEADVALGIFGGHSKAALVLPWKIYIAMAKGLPVISQSMYSTPAGCPSLPILHADSVQELVAGIRRLQNDTAFRLNLGREAQDYFCRHLDESSVIDAWRAAIDQGVRNHRRNQKYIRSPDKPTP